MAIMCSILKTIAPSKLTGRFEEAILVTTVRLGKPASAREIREDLEKCLDRKISIGVLYSTLERLEQKDLISSWEEGPTHKPGGRSKHLFEINQDGKRAVAKVEEFTKRVWQNVDEKALAV